MIHHSDKKDFLKLNQYSFIVKYLPNQKTFYSQFFILIFISLLVCSCKESTVNKSGTNENTAQAKKPETTIIADDNSLLSIVKNMGKVKANQIPKMISDANIIINHRYKETSKKAYIILDKNMWEYEFIFTGKSMTKPGQLAGMWIDFNEDQTYSYGYYNDDLGTGRYTYNLDTGLLLLIDDSEKVKPQEFEVKLFDQSMIMDGNEIYRDNNYNSKLRRIESKPIKVG